ncbi:MAG TPA: S49 family peptidase [Alphaproteobacteria bacterium]
MNPVIDGLRSLLARLPIGPLRPVMPVVAVLRLSGVIGGVGPLRTGMTLARLAGSIERAFSIPGVKAVALAINSPGGSPVQSSLIARRIRQLATEKKVPVVAFAEDVAASGGYWLACAADEIFADASSILGSIGVIAASFGFAEAIERIGVKRRIYTAGEHKSILDPFRPENPDDVERLKAVQAEIHAGFQGWVRERRGDRLRGTPEELFSGEFWTGRRALELGLIDGIDDLRSAMRRRFGDDVRLRVVGSERSWLRRRLLADAVLREVGAGDPPSLLPVSWAEDLLAAIEARSLWNRFGL